MNYCTSLLKILFQSRCRCSVLVYSDPMQRKIQKILVLEKSSGKLYFQIYHLIKKFNVLLFQMCHATLWLLHFHLLLLLKTETLLSNLEVIFLAFSSSFFYTQPDYTFYLQKDSYIAYCSILVFVFFLLQRDFNTFHKTFWSYLVSFWHTLNDIMSCHKKNIFWYLNIYNLYQYRFSDTLWKKKFNGN